jgi:hypothetical protein
VAVTSKVLAQVNPTAATETDAYTVPGATSAVVSTVVIANRSSTITTFRMSVAVAGAAANAKQYLFYDNQINGNSSITATLGITLAATDVIRVYATLANLSFNVFGQETS